MLNSSLHHHVFPSLSPFVDNQVILHLDILPVSKPWLNSSAFLHD